MVGHDWGREVSAVSFFAMHGNTTGGVAALTQTFLSLNHPIRWLFLLHALAGVVALLILIAPLVARKGGRLHSKTGWIYIYSMCFVGMSALIITPWRIFADPAKSVQSEDFALFLFFIAIFTLTSIWNGIQVLRVKSRTRADISFKRWAPPALTIFCGLATQYAGYRDDNILLLSFPLFGHATAVRQLVYWGRAPKELVHWRLAHLQDMGTACIATVTAFLVTALPRMVQSSLVQSPLLWFSPGIIGGVMISITVSRERKSFRVAELIRTRYKNSK